MFKTLNRTLIIAEIGNNHEGDFAVARDMVTRAADTGVDAVKFQTFIAEKFTAPSDPARFARLKQFQLTFDQFAELADLAHDKGLLFISTPLDIESAAFLGGIVDAIKIASGDNTYWALIDAAARTGKPMIISTGISNQGEIARAAETAMNAWSETAAPRDLALLHCIVSYPAPPEQANLAAIQTLANAFPEYTIGYSDHTIGIDAAVASVALGAKVVEKHFTLANDYSEFRDHQLSADPATMAELVERIRAVEAMRGNGELGTMACEQDLVTPVRRSIAAAHDLEAGTRLGLRDIVCIRPGGGLAPGQENQVLSKILQRPLSAGDMILPEDLADKLDLV